MAERKDKTARDVMIEASNVAFGVLLARVELAEKRFYKEQASGHINPDTRMEFKVYGDEFQGRMQGVYPTDSYQKHCGWVPRKF